MMHGFTWNTVAHLFPNNLFLIRVQVMERQAMREHMVFYFRETFAKWVMSSPEPIVYPTMTYGTKWTCTICILY
jgi:hypothetical protein